MGLAPAIIRTTRGSIVWMAVNCLVLRSKILAALKYFGLYKFAHRIDTDPILTAMASHGCSKVDWKKTAVRDGFVLYDFRTGEAYGLSKEAKASTKRIRSEDGASLSLVLPAVPSFFVKV